MGTPQGLALSTVFKFNPYHDENGRFASADGARGGTSDEPSGFYEDMAFELRNPKAIQSSLDRAGAKKVTLGGIDLHVTKNYVVDWDGGPDPAIFDKGQFVNSENPHHYFPDSKPAQGQDPTLHTERLRERLADAVGYKHLRRLPAFKANPYHDEKGRFTTADKHFGPGEGFVSPSVEEGMDVAGAQRGFSTTRHRDIRNLSSKVDEIIGQQPRTMDAIGAWADGAENTLVMAYDKGLTYTEVKAAMAMKGYLADQKAVIPFQVAKDGPDSMYEFTVPGTDVAKHNRDLVELGAEFHTMIPGANNTRVMVFDQGSGMRDTMERIGEHYDTTIDTRRGHGEFLGSFDSREEGRRAYESTLEKYFETAGPDRRRRWEKLRDSAKPSRKAEGLQAVLKYNPYRDERGRFATADGGSKGSGDDLNWVSDQVPQYARSNVGSLARKYVDRARSVEPGIQRNIASHLTGGAKLTGLENRLKGLTSMSRKIHADSLEKGISHEEAASQIRDAVRYTVEVPTAGEYTNSVGQVLGGLEAQGYEVTKYKDTWGKEPTGWPPIYQGVNASLKTPDGYEFELQFHTSGSLAAKHDNHQLYEDFRDIRTSQDVRDRLFTNMQRRQAQVERPQGLQDLKWYS